MKMIVKIDDMHGIDDFSVIWKLDKEFCGLTVLKGKECIFQKSYMPCPRENIESVKNLLSAHAIYELEKNKIIN